MNIFGGIIMQVINGHSVESFYAGLITYVVDGKWSCWSLTDLARLVGLDVEALKEVLL